MKFELISYSEKPVHSVEIEMTVAEFENLNVSSVDIARIKIVDEKTGRFTWFVLDIGIKRRPFAKLTAIDSPMDRIKAIFGKWRRKS